MKLAVDLGNSLQKAAVFLGDKIIHLEISVDLTSSIKAIFDNYKISAIIATTVIHKNSSILDLLGQKSNLLFFDENTPIPITNKYKTPETLGKDRLAAAIAGNNLYPNSNVLVIDAGTCLKYDFIDSRANYLGGGISPGLNMRFKALHTFTDKLPLIDISESVFLTGNDTTQSILSGVINGMLAEIDGIIDMYREKYNDIKVILSGGDADFLAGKLKNKIFAVPNIVLHGLKVVLDYNENL